VCCKRHESSCPLTQNIAATAIDRPISPTLVCKRFKAGHYIADLDTEIIVPPAPKALPVGFKPLQDLKNPFMQTNTEYQDHHWTTTIRVHRG